MEGYDNGTMRLKIRGQVDASMFIYIYIYKNKRILLRLPIDQLELVFWALQLSPVAITSSVRARIPLDSTCHVHKVPVIILFYFIILLYILEGGF